MLVISVSGKGGGKGRAGKKWKGEGSVDEWRNGRKGEKAVDKGKGG